MLITPVYRLLIIIYYNDLVLTSNIIIACNNIRYRILLVYRCKIEKTNALPVEYEMYKCKFN